MSWHFSQGQEAASWEGNSLDGAPFALLKLLPIAGSDFYNANGKDTCRHSPSGMTLRHLMGGHGMDSLMWFLGDSPVRTYLPLAEAQESAGAEADCGPTLSGSLAKFNPSLYGWKTRQCSLFGGLMSFAETWPRWGMMHDGELFPLPTPSGLNLLREVISLHSTTFGRESGFVQRVPTPTAHEAKSGGQNPDKRHAAGHQVSLRDAVKRVPTPRSEDSQCAGGHRDKDDTLYGIFSKDGKSNGPSGNELGRTVNRMPTPRANESTESRDTQLARETRGTKASRNLTESAGVVGGSLNPDWVEWLHGWPIGWTASVPLATDKFRQWLNSHGRCCPQ